MFHHLAHLNLTFFQANGIKPIKIPYHPQSNEDAEKSGQIVKKKHQKKA